MCTPKHLVVIVSSVYILQPTDRYVMELGSPSHTEEPPPPPNTEEPPPLPSTEEPSPASSPMAISEKSRQEKTLPEHSSIVVDPPHHASTNSPISLSRSISSVCSIDSEVNMRGSENILHVAITLP